MPIEKSDDDKSWDITLDLFKYAKLLTQETALPYLELLSSQKLESFDALKAKVNKEYKTIEYQVADAATQILKLINANGISFTDFIKALFPNIFLP